MICVSIGRGRHKQMAAEHQHLVEQGAKLVELRLDFIRRDVDLSRLLKNRPCPVIATCRREKDGGRWTQSEDKRQTLIREAIVSGVEYIDLEEDVASSVPRYGNTKRVISYHNFRETPENLEEIHARMAKLDPDIIKLATMAHNPHDNVRMLTLMQQSKIPTVGLCMGEIGTPSRILAGKFKAPFSYATFHHERALAPGQLSFEQMKNIYHYEAINEETEVYGVIADPVGHSLSPILHNTAFRQLGFNKVYVPFRVPREDLDAFIGDCPTLGVRGLSVTIPHKEEILDYCMKYESSVADIGAANTMVIEGQVRAGYNTDLQAAMESIDQAAAESNLVKPLNKMTALVLGAGGVAKAISYGLKRRGCDVVIAGRTLERAKDLADRLRCRPVEWSARYKVQPDIIVNCTPVGMHPNVDDTPFDKRHLKPFTIIFDTVYNPEQTLFIKDAREANCHTVSGVGMFIRQAGLQFEYFTGAEAPEELMRNVLKKTVGSVRF